LAYDEDDKIRRNLVAASFLTIVSAWFEIPFLKLAVKSLDSEAVAIPEWRLWSAGLSVFVYLLYRYRFSKEGHAYVYSVLDEVRKQLFFKVGSFVEQKAKVFSLSGKEPEIFGGVLSQAIAGCTEEFLREYPHEDGAKPSEISVTVLDRKENVWDISLGISVTYRLPDGATLLKQRSGLMLPKPSPAISILLNAWAWLHTLSYSEASVRNVFPIWMATIAIFVFIWRISQSYFVLWGGG